MTVAGFLETGTPGQAGHARGRVNGELPGDAELHIETCSGSLCTSELVRAASVLRSCVPFETCFVAEEKLFLRVLLRSERPNGTSGNVTLLVASRLDAAIDLQLPDGTLEADVKLSPLWNLTVPEVLRVAFQSVSASGEVLRLAGNHTREGYDMVQRADVLVEPSCHVEARA